MTENKNTLLIAITVLLAVLIYCFCIRYQMVSTAQGPTAYMYDRMTGHSWYYVVGEYMPCKPMDMEQSPHKK